jgi:hypothetical protein
MNDILTKYFSMKMGPKKGIAVILGDEEHCIASYSGAGQKIALKDLEKVDSSSLKDISRKAARMSLCFSPRGIYSDVGDFSSISKEATTAHIRSTIDKIGLFKDDYRIAFTKIQDIDDLKSRYSYLAIPSNEINRTDLIDENEALVDTFCPIESSIASAVGSIDKNMVVIVYEDIRFIRIIGAKSGIIYYLITINYAESFDAQADTVSGIREMTSMLQSSSQEKIQKIYYIGQGEINISDLEKHNIHTVPFSLSESGDADAAAIVLLGTAMNPCYDFTPEKLHSTKRIVGYSKISCAISLGMILMALVFFALGWSNSIKAEALVKRTNSAILKSSEQLRELERDYTSLSKNLDLTNINNIVNTYKDFQSEPKLHSIVQSITQGVPTNIFITKIEVNRASVQEDMPKGRAIPAAAGAQRTSHANSFGILIEGIINAPYPKSKEIFSSFIMTIQGVFPVTKAAYNHKEQLAEFSLNCEMKP